MSKIRSTVKKAMMVFMAVVVAFTAVGVNSNTVTAAKKTAKSPKGKVLVAYFSRPGGNYSVGNIKKGNTKIVAEMIAKQTGGKLFEIKTKKKYPVNYRKCTAVAEKEKNENARPKLKKKVKNMGQYDTIYLGYPIWYADMPMAVYTFLESYDFSGKTIIPFCTHEGSGLSGTPDSIKETAGGNVSMKKGFSIEGNVAQNSRAKTKKKVRTWVKKVSKGTKASKKATKTATSMSVTIKGKKYGVKLDKNTTVNSLLKMLPLNLSMEEFDEHEYYSELSGKPSVASKKTSKKTSKIKAGHIYYWDGWNAFVINYEDTDISPYKVVHVGEIKDKSVIDVLEKSEDKISVKVRAK